MKIIVDENIPTITVEKLKGLGYNVLDIRGTSQEGSDDEIIWEIALKEERLIITTDKGFSKDIYYPHFGIIIIKLKNPNRLKINDAVFKGLDKFSKEKIIGKTIIIKDKVIIERKIK